MLRAMPGTGRDERTSPFGAGLRYWRGVRGVSQLGLAASAGTTSRHVSFLETGRSRPSREMVVRLSAALEIPLRDRNPLLEAAGLAAEYRHEGVYAADLAPFRAAMERMLRAHQPYPALVVDRHWNVVLANDACALLFGDGLAGANMVRQYYANPHARQAILNWPDIAQAGLRRLRGALERSPLDAELRALVDLAESAVAGLPPPRTSAEDLTICPHFRAGDEVIRTIGMAARFESPNEITVEELRIELIYPADACAERFFHHHAEPAHRPAGDATTSPGIAP